MFSIVSHDIKTKVPFSPKVGGIVTFEGTVRNHNEGYKVSSLEYQCYEEMAQKEGELIVSESLKKFDIEQAFCIHRMGHLKIGEMAVWVYAAAAHRGQAFLACQYIIDEVKGRVPIWKKEHYLNKDPQWVACHQCHEHFENNERTRLL